MTRHTVAHVPVKGLLMLLIWLPIFRNAPICVSDNDAETQGGGFADEMRAKLSAAIIARWWGWKLAKMLEVVLRVTKNVGWPKKVSNAKMAAFVEMASVKFSPNWCCYAVDLCRGLVDFSRNLLMQWWVLGRYTRNRLDGARNAVLQPAVKLAAKATLCCEMAVRKAHEEPQLTVRKSIILSVATDKKKMAADFDD